MGGVIMSSNQLDLASQLRLMRQQQQGRDSDDNSSVSDGSVVSSVISSAPMDNLYNNSGSARKGPLLQTDYTTQAEFLGRFLRILGIEESEIKHFASRYEKWCGSNVSTSRTLGGESVKEFEFQTNLINALLFKSGNHVPGQWSMSIVSSDSKQEKLIEVFYNALQRIAFIAFLENNSFSFNPENQRKHSATGAAHKYYTWLLRSMFTHDPMANTKKAIELEGNRIKAEAERQKNDNELEYSDAEHGRLLADVEQYLGFIQSKIAFYEPIAKESTSFYNVPRPTREARVMLTILRQAREETLQIQQGLIMAGFLPLAKSNDSSIAPPLPSRPDASPPAYDTSTVSTPNDAPNNGNTTVVMASAALAKSNDSSIAPPLPPRSDASPPAYDTSTVSTPNDAPNNGNTTVVMASAALAKSNDSSIAPPLPPRSDASPPAYDTSTVSTPNDAPNNGNTTVVMASAALAKSNDSSIAPPLPPRSDEPSPPAHDTPITVSTPNAPNNGNAAVAAVKGNPLEEELRREREKVANLERTVAKLGREVSELKFAADSYLVELEEQAATMDALGAERDALLIGQDDQQSKRGTSNDNNVGVQALLDMLNELRKRETVLVAEKTALASTLQSSQSEVARLKERGDKAVVERDALLTERDRVAADRDVLKKRLDEQSQQSPLYQDAALFELMTLVAQRVYGWTSELSISDWINEKFDHWANYRVETNEAKISHILGELASRKELEAAKRQAIENLPAKPPITLAYNTQQQQQQQGRSDNNNDTGKDLGRTNFGPTER